MTMTLRTRRRRRRQLVLSVTSMAAAKTAELPMTLMKLMLLLVVSSSCLLSSSSSTTTCHGWTLTTTKTTACTRNTRQQHGRSKRGQGTTRPHQQQHQQQQPLYAKPPPISNFDLEAIEAFESEMDARIQQQQNDDIDLDDDDDDDDDDLFWEDNDDETHASNKNNNNKNNSKNNNVQIVLLTVPDHLDGARIDAVLAALLSEQQQQLTSRSSSSSMSLSRSTCGTLVTDGCVYQQIDNDDDDGNHLLLLDKKSIKVEAGTVLRVELPHNYTKHHDHTRSVVAAQDLFLSILYEDEHMIVLNKAAGMVVHPGAGNWDGTVVNALAYYLAHNSTYGSGEFVMSDVVGTTGTGTNTTTTTTTTTTVANNHNNDSNNDDNDEEGPESDDSSSSNSQMPRNNDNSIGDDDPTSLSYSDTDGEASTVSFRPGIVHRLDKGTTGILVVAKTNRALSQLSAAFASRTVKKTYLAITVGNPGKQVTIDKPIGRHPIHRQRMRVVPDPHRKDSSGTTPQQRQKIKLMEMEMQMDSSSNNSHPTSLSQSGRRALSYVDTLAFDGKLSLARVRIETGRTHQIRVHLQDRHTPIYGDDVYGISDWNKRLLKAHGIERPLLHAYRLELQHPITNKDMVFEAPMADDMSGIAKTLWPEGPEELPNAFQS